MEQNDSNKCTYCNGSLPPMKRGQPRKFCSMKCKWRQLSKDRADGKCPRGRAVVLPPVKPPALTGDDCPKRTKAVDEILRRLKRPAVVGVPGEGPQYLPLRLRK